MEAKIMKVHAVPTAGMVMKVGVKVPIIEPIVFRALSSPTIFPFSSRLLTAYLTSAGETLPRSIRGKTKRRIQERRDAHIRKLEPASRASARETTAITYLPTKGIAAVHTATIRMRKYILSGEGFLSASLPPQMFPSAIAIIIAPIIIVQTICEDEKYGARSLLAPSSIAMTDIPEKNSVR